MQSFFKKLYMTGDFWGGIAAMMVALPAAIAFGVTIYSAVAPSHAALGALAGIVGATVIGLIASTLGGTDRLISAPCAPAAAVLAAFAIELVRQGVASSVIVLLMIMLGVIAGLIQILLGFVGIGRLIRYIPYPVVSGYLSAVGLIIIGSQIPRFVGAAPDAQRLPAGRRRGRTGLPRAGGRDRHRREAAGRLFSAAPAGRARRTWDSSR